MSILSGLIDEKIEKVLTVFVHGKGELFHINKVAKESGVPLATTFRIINGLVSSGFLEIQKISKFKIYKLADNKKTRKLRDLL
ncbi:MAG: helix-turn-helix domain-containing protein [archaeon]